LGSLPQDPANTTSSGNYYTYGTNGTQFIITAIPESQKTKSALASNLPLPGYPEVLAQGSNLGVSQLFSPSGLVGYWPMDEGTGTTALDTSGNGGVATWSGTPVGTNGYYSTGKIGAYAGSFDGSTTQMQATVSGTISQFTVSQWLNENNTGLGSIIADSFGGTSLYPSYGSYFRVVNNNNFAATSSGYFGITNFNFWVGSWHLFTVTEDNATVYIYVDGSLQATSSRAVSGGSVTNPQLQMDKNYNPYGTRDLIGSLDDVRIYNRALSASEIQLLYNAQK
jgi:hypothetical protein